MPERLIDECNDHDYIILKTEPVPIPNPTPRIIQKEIYACIHCGTGLDCYNLDEFIEVRDA